jgi:hypothetical protein
MRWSPWCRMRLRYAGAGVLLVILVMWASSAFAWASWHRGHLWVAVLRGGISVVWCRESAWGRRRLELLPANWGRLFWTPECYTVASDRCLDVPLWIPFLLIGTPTAFLWWRDCRRIPPGYCQKCGYNLTGNVSGRCPECREKV